MLRDCDQIETSELLPSAERLRAEGWRLITASCVRRPADAFTVLYHFERAERLRHLRVELAGGEAVPSIGGLYAAAFLVENEMIELQGLAVSDLAIDYGGRLYRDFDALEGGIVEPGGTTGPADVFETAASLRLDACVPVTENGREVRASTSRVPRAEGEV